jgi:hypothetical protein
MIGGSVAGVAIFFASRNVTRQMRRGAEGREQDRIDRDLPGLRAALSFLSKFAALIETEPDTKAILIEFDPFSARAAPKDHDFAVLIEKAIPSTPDFARRKLVHELFKLRNTTERRQRCEDAWAHIRSQNAFLAAERRLSQEDEARQSEAKRDWELAQEEFANVIEGVLKYRDELSKQIESEQKQSDALRLEHDKLLGL